MPELPIVTVNEGKVRGIKQKSPYSGAEYYSFYGIPYAQPPIERLRFKDPVKVKPWKSIHDATEEKGGCVQFSLQLYQIIGSEDCLYVNIHTLKLPSEGDPLRPVIVNIHPGAYFFGSPDPAHYGSPNFVIHHDIVYVNIGFRLHILGFLNLGIRDCSGNQALKDIVMGLRWIKENIHFFNGDPENVTLLGSSSGSAIIHFLMLSPAARGLFHKAVIMGLHAFNPVVPYQEENESLAIETAQALGYRGDEKDKKKLLSFLKMIPPAVLIQQDRYWAKENYEKIAAIFPSGIFLPTIDHGKQAVLPDSPRKLLKSMVRIPLIFGMCEKESVMGFCRGGLITGTNLNFSTSFCQNTWGWGHNLNDDLVNFVNQQVASFYLNGDSINNAPLCVKVDIQTDAGFSDIYDTLINVIAAELPSSVYVYKFTYEGPIKTTKDVLSRLIEDKLQGTFHAADFSYWAYMPMWPHLETEPMVEIFTKLICTFAETGDPNYKGLDTHWNSSTPQNPCHLLINNPLKMMDGKINGERMNFWENLIKQVSIH